MYNNLREFYKNDDPNNYIYFRSIPTGKYKLVQKRHRGKKITVEQEIIKEKEISFEEVIAFSLDFDNNDQIVEPTSDDVLSVPNYFFNFWYFFLGADAAILYVLLKDDCFEGENFCCPDMELIKAKLNRSSQSSINRIINVLEKYDFIKKIQRLDKNNNKRRAVPFYKVRQNIPMLSQDLIEQLPDLLKEEHENFIK